MVIKEVSLFHIFLRVLYTSTPFWKVAGFLNITHFTHPKSVSSGFFVGQEKPPTAEVEGSTVKRKKRRFFCLAKPGGIEWCQSPLVTPVRIPKDIGKLVWETYHFWGSHVLGGP